MNKQTTPSYTLQHIDRPSGTYFFPNYLFGTLAYIPSRQTTPEESLSKKQYWTTLQILHALNLLNCTFTLQNKSGCANSGINTSILNRV